MKVLVLSLEPQIADCILDNLNTEYVQFRRVLSFLDVFEKDGHSIYTTRRSKNLKDLTHCLRRILDISNFKFDHLVLLSSTLKCTCAVYVNRLLRDGLLRKMSMSNISIFIQKHPYYGRVLMAHFHCWYLFGDRKDLPSEAWLMETDDIYSVNFLEFIHSLIPRTK